MEMQFEFFKAGPNWDEGFAGLVMYLIWNKGEPIPSFCAWFVPSA